MTAGVPSISIVIACHEMARELPRTVFSLSPYYQRDCAAREYEVIVVDNGSSDPPRREDFDFADGTLRVLHCTRESPSPVFAINEGLAAARGDLVGVWIDGARLASPGILAACRAAAELHPRAVIATLNYQLGPQLQHLAESSGYDRREEDRLLASIDWTTDGYRLFEIATTELPDGDAGKMLESNALFMSRTLWRELGGYDEAFVEPGGGVANPDTFVRANELPGVQLIRILGEGTFHQMHGGLSTSTLALAIETVRSGSRAYFRKRGRPFVPIRATGWLFDHRTGTVTR